MQIILTKIKSYGAFYDGVKLKVYFFDCSCTECCHCHYQRRTCIRISWVHNWTDSHSGGYKVERIWPLNSWCLWSREETYMSLQIVGTEYPCNFLTRPCICWRETGDIGRFCVTHGRFLVRGNSVSFKFFLIHCLLVLEVAIFEAKMLARHVLWETVTDIVFRYKEERHIGEKRDIMLSNVD